MKDPVTLRQQVIEAIDQVDQDGSNIPSVADAVIQLVRMDAGLPTPTPAVATLDDLARWKAELVPLESGLAIMQAEVTRRQRRIAAAEYLLAAAQDDGVAGG